MHVCVGHGFHNWFVECLSNWLAHFHLSSKLPACASKRCSVTVIHILLYPAFLYSSKKPEKEHLDQVGAVLLSYATALNFVFLLCCGTDVLSLFCSLTELSPQPRCCTLENLAHFIRKKREHTENVFQSIIINLIALHLCCIHMGQSQAGLITTTLLSLQSWMRLFI